MVRRIARSADDIADLLRSARQRLTRPEWSGSTYSGVGPAPGLDFTRPLPRNRSGVPLEPLPEQAGFRQPEYRARPVAPEMSGPREIRFPRTSVRETGEEFTEYFPEVVNPLSGTTSDAIDRMFDADPTGSYLSALEFVEDASTPNELYRAALLMRQIRPRLSRREMRVMERALDAAALRTGVPPRTTMGPTYLFEDFAFEPPQRTESTFGNYGALRREITAAAGGSVKKARKGGTVRLVNLSIFDNGVDGGVIRNARSTGQITELEEARLYEHLAYWRNQVLEGSGIDPSTINGLAGLRITDEMSEAEKYLRFSQAIRTANSPDEIAMIQAEIPGNIVSSSFVDTLADDMYAAMRRFESRGDMPEGAAVTARRVYGQSDDLERGGLETFTPEEEWVVRSLPRGAGEAMPAIEGDLKDITARVNKRLKSIGVGPLERRAVRAVPLETSARGVNIEPSELTGGGRLPISVENWEMYRQIQARKGISVPRNPEGYYRSGDYLLPRQSGMGAASGPSRSEGVGLSTEDINRAALEQIMEQGGAAQVGGTSPARVSAEALADGNDVQRAWAARYGQARVDELESADPNVRRAAVRATQRGVQEGVISDRMLAELRAASVRSGITAKNPAGRGGPLRGQPRQPAVEAPAAQSSAQTTSFAEPPSAPSVTPGSGKITPPNPETNQGYRSYVPRTIDNAQSSDITIAVANDFNTNGERLTYGAARGSRRAEFGRNPNDPNTNYDHWYSVRGREGEFGTPKPIVQVKHMSEDLDSYIDQIVKELNATAQRTGQPVSINGAGNGLARLGSQAEADIYARHIISRLLAHPDRKFEIGVIRSGGQNGYDVAFNKAAKVYGIPTEINPSYSNNGMVNVQRRDGRSEQISVQEYVRRYRLATGEIGDAT